MEWNDANEFARACGRGDETAVTMFLGRGMDPNALTHAGTTPLQHAKRYPHIAKILEDAGGVVAQTPVRHALWDIDPLDIDPNYLY